MSNRMSNRTAATHAGTPPLFMVDAFTDSGPIQNQSVKPSNLYPSRVYPYSLLIYLSIYKLKESLSVLVHWY